MFVGAFSLQLEVPNALGPFKLERASLQPVVWRSSLDLTRGRERRRAWLKERPTIIDTACENEGPGA